MIRMIEFFITRVSGGFELTADGKAVDTFKTEGAAADMAVRFAQDNDALGYRIFYP